MLTRSGPRHKQRLHLQAFDLKHLGLTSCMKIVTDNYAYKCTTAKTDNKHDVKL